jgi:hypothetical protein
MAIQEVCGSYIGPSDFRGGGTGGAVWFHQDAGTGRISRFSWQGLRAVRAIQQRLGVTQDGKWGSRTNTALRAKMRQMGLDSSIVRENEVTPAMLQAGLTVAYTIGTLGAGATAPAATVCLPRTAVPPLWNTRPEGPEDGGPDAQEVILDADGSPSATQAPWRVPNGATILANAVEPVGGARVVVYRAVGAVPRRAILAPDGALTADEELTDDDLVSMGLPPETTSLAPPGTPAPQASEPPTRADGYGDGAPPPPADDGSTRRKWLLAGSGLVGLLAVGVVASIAMQPAPAPALPPGPPPAPSPPATGSADPQPPTRSNGKKRGSGADPSDAPVYLAGVILYDLGRAYDKRVIDKAVRITDATTLAQIVRRLKVIGALKKSVKLASLRQDERYWPSRLNIVRRRDDEVLVELDRYDG